MKLRPILLTLLCLPAIQGCKPMLYPVARAFGGPSEGELKLRRAAFDRLKATRATAKILVYPALRVRRGKPTRPRPPWRWSCCRATAGPTARRPKPPPTCPPRP